MNISSNIYLDTLSSHKKEDNWYEKRIKKLLSAVLVSTFIIGTMAMQAFAYNDGDREVLYYNFTFGNGELVQTSSSSMKRLYNREWVVTVDSVKTIGMGLLMEFLITMRLNGTIL